MRQCLVVWRGLRFRRLGSPARVQGDRFLDGFSIFAIALVLLVILTLFAGVKTVPQGYNWTVERFGKYTRTLRAGPQPHRPVTSTASGAR